MEFFPSSNQVTMATQLRNIILSFFFFLALSSGLECKHPAEPPPPILPLVADAGPDQTIQVGNYVILDGSKSSGGRGDTLIYRWIELSGNPRRQSIEYYEHAIAYSGFTKVGTYRFCLTVSDGVETSVPDTIVVLVNPRAQVVFEDPCLEVKARWALKKPSGDLTDADLLSMIGIPGSAIAVNDTITSLVGLERCTNVIALYLSLEAIEDISPLAALKEMKYLLLDQNNKIRYLTPLSGLAELEYLDINQNQITDVSPLAGLTKLVYLNIMYNPIGDISMLGGLTALEQLWVSRNPIAGNISVLANFRNLQLLWVKGTQVKDIAPLAGLTNLEVIDLGENQIVDITPLRNLTKLWRIDLWDNQIEDISVLQYMTNAKVISLDNNRVIDLLPLVNNPGFTQGDILSVAGNPLSDRSVNEYIPALAARGVIVIRLY